MRSEKIPEATGLVIYDIFGSNTAKNGPST